MMNKLLLTVMLSIACGASAVTLEKSSEAEKQTSIMTKEISEIYGAWLFSGGFKTHSFSGINPDYRISQGDTVLIQLWGGIDFQAEVKVDPKGNIFLPKIGPVKILGVKNKDLQAILENSVKRVFKHNVRSYISLLSTQKIKVFLSGLVNKPGIYEGQSADSILRFIDQAGGIRNDLGSFRHILIKRYNKILQAIDLYSFINHGNMPATQLHDGDVIFIGRKKSEVYIEGEVGFKGSYELKRNPTKINDLVEIIKPNANATHVTVIENNGSVSEARQYKLSQLKQATISSGAKLKFTSQLRQKTISIEVIGEHQSAQERIIPWGTNLNQILNQISYTSHSDKNGFRLYRKSVAKRQKDMLQASLSALEQSVLTARSSSKEEAELRKSEAQIILQWIEKAKQVEPRGQVLLTEGYNPEKIRLQQGDKIVIPSKKNLVMIHGEVLFPTAIAFKEKLSIEKYVKKAGGSTQDLDDMNVLLMKANGSFIDVNDELRNKRIVKPGDEIFVLPKPEVKSLQLTKDVSTIIYQIAVAAAVVIGL